RGARGCFGGTCPRAGGRAADRIASLWDQPARPDGFRPGHACTAHDCVVCLLVAGASRRPDQSNRGVAKSVVEGFSPRSPYRFFSTCLSIHASKRSARSRLFRSCISMWLLPLIPSFGRYIISASPPASFICWTKFWQPSKLALQFAGQPPCTSLR